jgi:predicted ATPase
MRCYYLLGITGVGKSTLLAGLSDSGLAVRAVTEWPDPMPEEIAWSPDAFDARQQERIQDWIFTQVAKKNRQLAELVSGSIAVEFEGGVSRAVIVDRSPLDTFAFYPRELWPLRARQTLGYLQPGERFVAGELLLLKGDPTAVCARMHRDRHYDVETLAAQQRRFLDVAHELGSRRGNDAGIHIINAAVDRAAVLEHVASLLTTDSYHPVDIHACITTIAAP